MTAVRRQCPRLLLVVWGCLVALSAAIWWVVLSVVL